MVSATQLLMTEKKQCLTSLYVLGSSNPTTVNPNENSSPLVHSEIQGKPSTGRQEGCFEHKRMQRSKSTSEKMSSWPPLLFLILDRLVTVTFRYAYCLRVLGIDRNGRIITVCVTVTLPILSRSDLDVFTLI